MSTGYLRRFPRFDDLTDADVAILERIMIEEVHPPGHVFVREGAAATSATAALYLVIEGTISVAAARPEGGFGVDRALGPGQIFGHVVLVADVRRTATCKAATRVVVARLDRLVFEELYRRNAGVHARFQLVVARQLASDVRSLREILAKAIATGDDAPLRDRFG